MLGLADSSVLALGRADFMELLGPLAPQMAKEAEDYLKAGWKGGAKRVRMRTQAGRVHVVGCGSVWAGELWGPLWACGQLAWAGGPAGRKGREGGYRAVRGRGQGWHVPWPMGGLWAGGPAVLGARGWRLCPLLEAPRGRVPRAACVAPALKRLVWAWLPLQEVPMHEVHARAVLGAGGFGQVLLVEHRGRFCALKCVAKKFIIDQGLVKHIKRERVSARRPSAILILLPWSMM